MHRVILDPRITGAKISKNIYGHFSEHLGHCVYQGLYVGEDSAIPNRKGIRTDVVDALRKIGIPVLRWPGGCFADEYHWEDGIGPKPARRRMVNTNWGGMVEDNSFGTHEFLELCSQLGCEPYINANVGSGTVREMAEWVEYLNSAGDSTVAQKRWANGRREPWGVKYWGIGNETWGGGGNMHPEYYADVYRRYQTYCRDYGENKLFRIACGASEDDYRWTDVLMERAGKYMDAITMHCYTIPGNWEKKGSATVFDRETYDTTLRHCLRMEEIVSGHEQVMHRYDPEHRVGLIVDEWGTWYDVEPGTSPGFLYQQNTMRDAQVAALTLNIFNNHCDRVVMANLAQTVNVLQAVILTDGAKMVCTPTYHVFELFKAHQEGTLVPGHIDCDESAPGLKRLSASASLKGNSLTVTLANTDPKQPCEAALNLCGLHPAQAAGRVLAEEMHAMNTFEAAPVAPCTLHGIACEGDAVRFTLPPCAVAEMTVTL